MCHYAAAFLGVVVIKHPYCAVAVINGGDIPVLSVSVGIPSDRGVNFYYGVFICQTAVAELVGDGIKDASHRCCIAKFHAEIDVLAEIDILVDF